MRILTPAGKTAGFALISLWPVFFFLIFSYLFRACLVLLLTSSSLCLRIVFVASDLARGGFQFGGLVLFDLVLSCLLVLLSCPCLVLSCLVLSCLVLVLVLSCLVSCLVLSCIK